MFFRRFFDAPLPGDPPTAAPGRLRAGGYRDLTPAQARALAGARLIDVREPEELQDRDLGRIQGTVNLPMGIVGGTVAGWDRAMPVVLVCRSGRRSAWVAADLVEKGFSQVYNLAGGMIAWNEAGLPVLRG